MLPSVLLRHELPDGSWHYDWLIDPIGQGESEERNLIAFRLAQRPDEAPFRFAAERLPDHRRLYLEFEGRVPGRADRGVVHRVSEWQCQFFKQAGDSMEFQLEGGGHVLRFKGEKSVGGTDGAAEKSWIFESSRSP